MLSVYYGAARHARRARISDLDVGAKAPAGFEKTKETEFQGAALTAFRYEIVAFLIIQLVMVQGPLLVFAPTLFALKRRGRREYDALAARYTREFHDKWIRGGAPAGEALMGSADIQSLADLANSYEVVGTCGRRPLVSTPSSRWPWPPLCRSFRSCSPWCRRRRF
jgi:hypothetical protein